MRNILTICLIIISISWIPFASGRQLSMVALKVPFGSRKTQSIGKTPNNNLEQRSADNDITSSSSVTSALISKLACMSLKRRLQDHAHVSCDLTANSNQLLLGRIGPVTVKGRGWESPLGLTCRAIEATVNECKLDMGRVIANQKLVLTTPANGRAMVALSATDFGNFLTHPFVKPPRPPTNYVSGSGTDLSESRLSFEKENVSVNPSTGSVIFYGNYAGSKWKFTMQRSVDSPQRAEIQVTLDKFGDEGIYHEGMEEAIAVGTSEFFNDMVFDLDGTFLSFEDMMLTDKGKESSVLLSLQITVKKFPSPGIEF